VKTLPEQVAAVVGTGRVLRRGEAVVVGVSGGVDSMVLLHLLHELSLSPQHDWVLSVAHFNHQLRGRASDGDERLVCDTAKLLGLRCVVGRADVESVARRKGISIEMAARERRHAFLARTAERLGARAIALAHHADDQVELFFLRLLRGAGAEGIAGMKRCSPSPADCNISLVRPLLDFCKAELVAFARAQAIPFRQDASNDSPDPLRNRVRLELLPLLRRRFQPAVDRVVRRLMEIADAESEALTSLARVWFRREGRGRSWSRWPVALQRRFIRAQLDAYDIVPGFDLVEALRLEPARSVSVGPGRAVVLDGPGRVRMCPAAALRFDLRRRTVALRRQGQSCFDGLQISWRIGPRKPGLIRKPRLEFFDAGRVGARITLRHWRPGDRFQPIGLKSAVKLQDWFVNQKIPAERRRRLVLAATARGEIFWVEGLRIGERFKLTAATRRQLRWAWRV
jgi:tRNA(Ile)-lysidine synthase